MPTTSDAITRKAKRRLGTKIVKYQEDEMETHGRVAGGLELWCIIIRYFLTDNKGEPLFTLKDLQAVRMMNDDIEGFLDNWDTVIRGLKHTVADDILELEFFDRIKGFSHLKEAFYHYNHANEESKDVNGNVIKCYEWLRNQVTQHIDRERKAYMRRAYHQSIVDRNKGPGKTPPAGPAPANGGAAPRADRATVGDGTAIGRYLPAIVAAVPARRATS